MSSRLFLILAMAVVGLAAPAPARAADRPDLVGYASFDRDVLTLGESTIMYAEMANEGTRPAINAFFNMVLPVGVGYSIRSSPRGGSCRAARVGSSTLLYCMVTVRPGATATLALNVTPSITGDITFNVNADPSNMTRELDETNNVGSAVLTVE